MDKSSIIVVTGAAGFIGSCMVQFLNDAGYYNIIMADDFGVEEKRDNWTNKEYTDIVERLSLIEWLQRHNTKVACFIHLGARTDTTEFNYAIHEELNVAYSKSVWQYCIEKKVPLIYASSAATYGAGEFGYEDNHEIPYKLTPLNPYGVSKNEFDKWALQQESHPPFWAGLKFFNVYGPNEYHKGRMASVIWHSFNQINKGGVVKLFKSHRPDFKDGQQLRDFIYVKDLINVIMWMMEKSIFNSQWSIEETQTNDQLTTNSRLTNGLYNLGTGKARSFEDLVKATFAGLDLPAAIEYVDMPLDIRDKYQYFTEANMQKLKDAGYNKPFYSLESGVDDYVRNYLNKGLKKY